MTNLASIEERAQRVLDGMIINREALARDVLALCKAAARKRAEVVHLLPKVDSARTGGGGFTEIFGKIFGGNATRNER